MGRSMVWLTPSGPGSFLCQALAITHWSASPCFLLPGSSTSDSLPTSDSAFSLPQKCWSPAAVSRRSRQGQRDAAGAAASRSSALQSSTDKANKAGLFVFCVSSEMSWQFCNNTEELHFTASPKYSHMAVKVLSRAWAVPPLPSRTPTQPSSRLQSPLWGVRESCRFSNVSLKVRADRSDSARGFWKVCPSNTVNSGWRSP